jgi:ribosome recycling factor
MAAASKPDLAKHRDRMDKAVAALKEEFGGLRTGRANAGLLEPVQVDAYGSMVPLNSVGAISVPEPRMITVSVWDKGTVRRWKRRSAPQASGSTP